MKSSPLSLLILIISLLACSLPPAPAALSETTIAEVTASATLFPKTDLPQPIASAMITPTPSPQATLTPTANERPQPASTPTATPRPTNTSTATNTRQPASTPTDTPQPTATTEPTQPPQTSGIVNGDAVNLRSGPGTEFEVVGRVVLSQTVEIVGRNADSSWWQICCMPEEDERVWIIAEFVETNFSDETVTSIAEIKPEAVNSAGVLTETTALSEAITGTPGGIVSGDAVNLRSGPGTEFDIVDRITLSQTVTIVGRNEDASWWQICCRTEDEVRVWITAEFVETNFPAEQATGLIPLEEALVAVDSEPSDQIAADKTRDLDIAMTTVSETPEPTPEGTESGSPTEVRGSSGATPPAGLPAPGGFSPSGDLNPLTGLSLSPQRQAQRPVIICINNDAQARPQFGLSQADVMYEYLMEGYGITRFSGIFFSEAVEQIGPVRSARLVNYYLGSLYDAPLLCSGASDQVRYLLKNEAPFPYLDIDLDDPANRSYSISVGKDYRTRVRTNTAGFRRWLADWGEERAANIRGFTFGPLQEGGVETNAIAIPYPSVTGSNVEYHYNPVTRRYLRYLDGFPHADGNTGAQLALDNVIVQYVPHETTDIVEDSLGSTSIRLNLFGSNKALLFRDGVVFEGSWESASQGDVPHFFDQNGAEIPLKPGKTWISIVPERYEVEY